MIYPRLLADVFHNVDFATLRPANRADIFSQQPKRGPYALSCRQLDARFEPPVRLREQSFRLQPRRGVLEFRAVWTGIWLLPRCNHQLPVINSSILRAVRVVLEFTIAPPAAAN